MNDPSESKEQPLFALSELDVPPSPLERRGSRRREGTATASQRPAVRTKDNRAATAGELVAEWVNYVAAEGLSETGIPTELRGRVGRTLQSLIKKGFRYEELVFALRIFTTRDLRDRKYAPKQGNLEIYARQYRGESEDESRANDAERERLRLESLARGVAPSSGTPRQNRRDATLLAIREAWRTDQEPQEALGVGDTDSRSQIES